METAKLDENKKAEKRLALAMPASHELSIAKLIKQGPNQNPYKIEEEDMNDFRIPVDVFRKYSSIMKSLNNEVQKSFLRALGIDAGDKYGKIGWEKFVELNCLLKLNTATLDDYIAFFQKVIDPRSQGKVPKEEYEETLFDLFKGQFQLSGWTKDDDMSADVIRLINEKGCMTEDGALNMETFTSKLKDSEIDIQVFLQAIK